jgi:hypothetical protein
MGSGLSKLRFKKDSFHQLSAPTNLKNSSQQSSSISNSNSSSQQSFLTSKSQPPNIPTPIKDNIIEAYSLLLCGAGESGKTTFIQQMKLNYFGEFSNDERKEFVETIRGNLVETMQKLLVFLEKKRKRCR